LAQAAKVPGVTIFHAGTKQDGPRVLANGGRVLGIVGRGKDAKAAQAQAYAAVDKVDWPEGFCRRDIGWQVAGKP
jgi:phosphoribosylamine--glycine ligase